MQDSEKHKKLPDHPQPDLKNHSLSSWTPFDKKDYRWPLNDSTYIIWRPLRNLNLISGYSLQVFYRKRLLKELLISKNKTSILVMKLELPDRGKRYELALHALQKDGGVVMGNQITIKYS